MPYRVCNVSFVECDCFIYLFKTLQDFTSFSLKCVGLVQVCPHTAISTVWLRCWRPRGGSRIQPSESRKAISGGHLTPRTAHPVTRQSGTHRTVWRCGTTTECKNFVNVNPENRFGVVRRARQGGGRVKAGKARGRKVMLVPRGIDPAVPIICVVMSPSDPCSSRFSISSP